MRAEPYGIVHLNTLIILSIFGDTSRNSSFAMSSLRSHQRTNHQVRLTVLFTSLMALLLLQLPLCFCRFYCKFISVINVYLQCRYIGLKNERSSFIVHGLGIDPLYPRRGTDDGDF